MGSVLSIAIDFTLLTGMHAVALAGLFGAIVVFMAMRSRVHRG